MNHSRLKYLLTRYAKGDMEKAELQELLELIDAHNFEDKDSVLDKLITEHLDIDQQAEKFSQDRTLQKIWSRLADRQMEDHRRPIIRTWKKPMIWGVAAALIGILILFSVWFLPYESDTLEQNTIVMDNDILLPNDAQVSLRLKDGTEYNLMEMDRSALAERGIEIMSDETEGLLFVVKQRDEEAAQQTFKNSKGNTAKLQLADGSTVLLNSGASITYPSSFGATERRVQVTGELYFEVTPNPEKPFVVSTGNTAVKVLGTAFNITADTKDNEVHTTLVEGAVEVSSKQNVTKLTPGTQAIVNHQGDIQVSQAVLRDVLAWKNGYFSFDDYNIDRVMEQLRKWYDIEELHIEARTQDLFVASITRKRRLSEVLGQLEKISSYKFKIEERRVTVMK